MEKIHGNPLIFPSKPSVRPGQRRPPDVEDRPRHQHAVHAGLLGADSGPALATTNKKPPERAKNKGEELININQILNN